MLSVDAEVLDAMNNGYSLHIEQLLKRPDVQSAVTFISGVLYSQQTIAGNDAVALLKKLIPSRQKILGAH